MNKTMKHDGVVYRVEKSDGFCHSAKTGDDCAFRSFRDSSGRRFCPKCGSSKESYIMFIKTNAKPKPTIPVTKAWGKVYKGSNKLSKYTYATRAEARRGHIFGDERIVKVEIKIVE